jgi:acetylornithine deacetylase/succinyl-diaminopimelate desuccinylase-like protein
LRIDRRIIPEENPADAEATLTRQIRESAAKWPEITCNIRRILLAVPFVPIPGQENLVAAIARHATRIMGEEVKPHGVPIYTDARSTRRPASPPCCTAPDPTRCSRRTVIAPTRS